MDYILALLIIALLLVLGAIGLVYFVITMLRDWK